MWAWAVGSVVGAVGAEVFGPSSPVWAPAASVMDTMMEAMRSIAGIVVEVGGTGNADHRRIRKNLTGSSGGPAPGDR